MAKPDERIQSESFWSSLLKLFTNRNYIILILINICNNFALTMGKTPLTLYGMSLGMTGAVVGAMNGTYYLVVTLARPFTGITMDKFNRKLVLMACISIKIAGYILLANATDYTSFLIGRLVDAVSFAFITTTFFGVTSQVVDRKAMGTSIGLFSGIPTLIVSAVPTLSMLVFQKFGGPTLFYLGIAALVLALILTMFLKLPEVKKEPSTRKFSLNDVFYLKAVPVCMLNFFLSMLMTICDTYLVVMALERGIAGAEIYATIKSMVTIIAGVGLGGLSDYFGGRKILIAACVGTAIASVMYGSAQSLLVIIAASVIYSVLQKGANPVLIKAAANSAPDDKRGAAMSTNYFIQDLAGVGGGYIAGICFTYFGYAGSFYVSAIFPIVGLILFLILSPKEDKKRA